MHSKISKHLKIQISNNGVSILTHRWKDAMGG